MTKYLITPTLLNSFYFFKKIDSEKRNNEFKALLAKDKFEPNALMLQGIAFEDNVMAICDNQNVKQMPTAQEMADIVKGGTWQVRVKRDISINGQMFLLYGRADVIKEDTIIDIKRCADNSIESGKYQSGKYQFSVQHKIYMICTPIKKFMYLISDGKNIAKEHYTLTIDTIDDVIQAVSDFWEWIHMEGAEEYKELYLKKWICKY